MSGGADGRAGPDEGGRPGGGLRRAWPALLLGLFGVSWAAVLVRMAAAPASAVAFWRLAFSTLLVLPLLAASGDWRDLRGLAPRDWLWIGAGGCFLSLHLVAWFASLAYTSVASSTVLVTAHPIFVGLLSAAVLDESPGRREWTGILVAVAGAVVIGWGDFGGGAEPLLGDLLAVIGALLTALYFVVGRRLRPRLGLWGYVGPVYLAAAAVSAVVVSVSGASFGGYPPVTWILFAALAVGPMLLGHTSFNWALEHVRAYVVSVVVLLEPVGATLIAVLVLGRGEAPTPTTLAGGLAVLGGVWISLRARAASGETSREGKSG